MQALIFHNETRGDRFIGATDTSDFSFVGSIEVAADADPLAVCESVYRVGQNDLGHEQYHALKVRSLSVGDLVVIPAGAYTVDSFGFASATVPMVLTAFAAYREAVTK